MPSLKQPPTGKGVPNWHGKNELGPPAETARREGERCHSCLLGGAGGVDDIFIHRSLFGYENAGVDRPPYAVFVACSSG